MQQKIIIFRFLFKLNPLYTKLEQEIYWKEAEENLTGHLRNHHGAFCKIPKDQCGPSLGIINMKNHEISPFCALLKRGYLYKDVAFTVMRSSHLNSVTYLPSGNTV